MMRTFLAASIVSGIVPSANLDGALAAGPLATQDTNLPDVTAEIT